MIPLQTPAQPQVAPIYTGVDRVLANVREILSEQTFLGAGSLGRVKPQRVRGNMEPWIKRYDLDAAGEYYRAYPNDELPAFSCLYAHDDERYDETGILITRTMSIIVWLNLEAVAIDAETAKFLILQTLDEVYNVATVNRSYDQTVDGPNGIYPGFDVDDLEERYMTYPFAGFRIECSIAYQNLCY